MKETKVRSLGWEDRSLGWEDPLEKEMASHSSILAWEIPGTEEPGKLQSMGSKRVGHDLATKHHHHHVLKLKTRMLPKKPED